MIQYIAEDGRFDAMCTSRFTPLDARWFPYGTSINCKPCLEPSRYLKPCNCCLKFKISGLSGTLSGGLDCETLNEIVTLTPHPYSADTEGDSLCTWVETQESRGSREWGYAASYNPLGGEFKIVFGGPSPIGGTWRKNFVDGNICGGDFFAEWASTSGEDPYASCEGSDEIRSIFVEPSSCLDCSDGLCQYTNFWDGVYHNTFILDKNTCKKTCVSSSNSCSCPELGPGTFFPWQPDITWNTAPTDYLVRVYLHCECV